MNLATRRAKDAFVRQKADEGFFADLNAEQLVDFLEELKAKFHSRKMPLHQIWTTISSNVYHHKGSPEGMYQAIKARQRRRSLELRIEPEYYI